MSRKAATITQQIRMTTNSLFHPFTSLLSAAIRSRTRKRPLPTFSNWASKSDPPINVSTPPRPERAAVSGSAASGLGAEVLVRRPRSSAATLARTCQRGRIDLLRKKRRDHRTSGAAHRRVDMIKRRLLSASGQQARGPDGRAQLTLEGFDLDRGLLCTPPRGPDRGARHPSDCLFCHDGIGSVTVLRLPKLSGVCCAPTRRFGAAGPGLATTQPAGRVMTEVTPIKKTPGLSPRSVCGFTLSIRSGWSFALAARTTSQAQIDCAGRNTQAINFAASRPWRVFMFQSHEDEGCAPFGRTFTRSVRNEGVEYGSDAMTIQTARPGRLAPGWGIFCRHGVKPPRRIV